MKNLEENVNEVQLVDDQYVEANVDANVDDAVVEQPEEGQGRRCTVGAIVGTAGGVLLGGAAAVFATMELSADVDENNNLKIAPSDPNDIVTPAVKIIIDDTLPVAHDVNDDMSFGEAFATARAEVGAGGAFEWRGGVYGTYTADEWNAMTAEQKVEYNDKFDYELTAGGNAGAKGGEDNFSVEDITFADSVNDEMSFDEAYAAARAEVGAGGAFVWRGNVYGTYASNEWNAMSAEQRATFTDNCIKMLGAAKASDTPETIEQHNEPEPEPEPEPKPIPEPFTPEIRVIDVYDVDDARGRHIDVAHVQMDGENVYFADVDRDGIADVLVEDVNGDGAIDCSEVVDVEEFGISLEQMAESIAPNPVAPIDPAVVDTPDDGDFMA
ncbi:MAG: hypothetical protein IKB15_03230 [Alistipes sp.]|nr:hypothetical protein [Alistipes sp.]